MRCLGHKHGTDCVKTKRTLYQSKSQSWKKYQLCGICVKDSETLPYRREMDSAIEI